MTIVGILRMAEVARAGREHPLRGARRRGGGDRSADPTAARPRHDPGVGAEDQPGGDRRGRLAARRCWRQSRRSDPGAGVRRSRRAVERVTGADVPHALLEANGAGGDPARGARGQRRAADARGELADGRHRHAPALRLDGGGHGPALAQGRRGRGRRRRRTGRDRDRQGEHGLRVRHRRHGRRDPGSGGGHPACRGSDRAGRGREVEGPGAGPGQTPGTRTAEEQAPGSDGASPGHRPVRHAARRQPASPARDRGAGALPSPAGGTAASRPLRSPADCA